MTKKQDLLTAEDIGTYPTSTLCSVVGRFEPAAHNTIALKLMEAGFIEPFAQTLRDFQELGQDVADLLAKAGFAGYVVASPNSFVDVDLSKILADWWQHFKPDVFDPQETAGVRRLNITPFQQGPRKLDEDMLEIKTPYRFNATLGGPTVYKLNELPKVPGHKPFGDPAPIDDSLETRLAAKRALQEWMDMRTPGTQGNSFVVPNRPGSDATIADQLATIGVANHPTLEERLAALTDEQQAEIAKLLIEQPGYEPTQEARLAALTDEQRAELPGVLTELPEAQAIFGPHIIGLPEVTLQEIARILVAPGQMSRSAQTDAGGRGL